MSHPADDLKKQLDAIVEHLSGTAPFIVQLAAIDAYMLTALLSLATQHPHIGEATRQIGGDVGRRIQQSIATITDAPPSYQLVEFGDADEVGQLLAKAFADAPEVQVELSRYETFNAITLLQLVTRHPDLPKLMATGAESIGRQLQTHLGQVTDSPEIDQTLEYGWHPEFDVDPDGNPVEGEDQ